MIVEHCSVDRLRRFALCGATIPFGALPLVEDDIPAHGCLGCLKAFLEAHHDLVERFALERNP